jgi:hypothetical protein
MVTIDDLTPDEDEVRPLEELESGYPLWWLNDGAAAGLHEDLDAVEPAPA